MDVAEQRGFARACAPRSVNYQPILYARNVRQCVRIIEMDKDVLRTGVRARVVFEFMYRPEFVQQSTKVLFTEGKTKAIGTIRELIAE